MIRIKVPKSMRGVGMYDEAVELSNQCERIMKRFFELPPEKQVAVLIKAEEIRKEEFK